jgi:hypothetical protein
MLSRFVIVLITVSFLPSLLTGQETQSLGEIARKLREQQKHPTAGSSQSTTSNNPAPLRSDESAKKQPESLPVVAPAPTISQVPIGRLDPDVAKDIQWAEKYGEAIRQLLQQEKFEELDRIATEARATKARFAGGTWKLNILYLPLTTPPSEYSATDSAWQEHLAHLQHWMKQRPGSITARVSLGWFYINYGWYARGGGFSDSVAQEGWQLLAERAQTARQILEEAQSLPEKCPEWFSAMQSIAAAQEWDAEETNALFEKAIAFEPDYYDYYTSKAENMLPKWGGEEGDAARFAETMADRIGGKKGDLIYYQIGNYLNCACDHDAQITGMSWPRIKKGYLVGQELYGKSITRMNAMAYMAINSADFDYADTLFTEIGDSFNTKFWPTRDYFENDKRKASSAIFQRHYQEALANAKTPEGQAFHGKLAQTVDKSYHANLMECMKTTPDYRLSALGLLMELGKDGKPVYTMIVPRNAAAACFQPYVEKATLPAPPRENYWVAVDLDITK